MILCAIAQIVIAIVIMTELSDEKIIFNVAWWITLVRFICISLLHFSFANEYNLAVKCLKYLALNQAKFKYVTRGFMSCNL